MQDQIISTKIKQNRITSTIVKNNSILCVGIDPIPDKMLEKDLFVFCSEIVAATKEHVAAFKFQFAFFEQFGSWGVAVLEKLLSKIRIEAPEKLIIADAKRGDIAHSNQAYATAIFDKQGFDAATVAPYIGFDALSCFTNRNDKTTFVLCRTSNPNSETVQKAVVEYKDTQTRERKSKPLFEYIAEICNEMNINENVGIVVGATNLQELKFLRKRYPQLPFLIPGIGAQKGDLENTVASCVNGNSNAPNLINSSRSILYAGSSRKEFAQAAQNAANKLNKEINYIRHKSETH